MKKIAFKALSYLLTLTVLSSLSSVFVSAAEGGQTTKQSNLTTADKTSGNTVLDYRDYIAQYPNAAHPDEKIVIQGADFAAATTKTEVVKIEGHSVVTTTDEGYIEWKANIPATGMYQIKVNYYSVEGKGSSIERKLYIDGVLPFDEAQFLSFNRFWEYASDEFAEDINGNQQRPQQNEIHRFETVYLKDSNGYVQDPLCFYFTKGTHTLRLEAVRENMGIESITLCQAEPTIDYATYDQQNPADQYSDVTVTFEAEKISEKSSVSLIPGADRTNAFVTPQDPFYTKLNCINCGSKVGEFMSWDFHVDQPGRYQIITRYKQNGKSGTFVTRSVKLDGETPFEEAKEIQFLYTNSWKEKPVGNGEQAYEFYLEAGDHTLTLEVALGDFAPIVESVNGVLTEVNAIYRNILMITGASPDLYRDYEFETIIPDSVANMKTQAEILQQEVDRLVEITGKKGSDTAVLDKLIFQLETMNDDPDKIASMLADFQSSCSSLGDWVLTAKTQPLELDWISVIPANQKHTSHYSFWDQICYSVMNFISSFVVDYNTMGLMSESPDNKIVNVWAVTGRDQAQIIQRLADASLSEKGITVKVKLVSQGTLLPSVLSGSGPDVSLFNACSDPINYAIRKANVELSQFEGFDQVIEDNFVKESLLAYQFEGGTYALPETTYFPMMFYRQDIFDQLGLSIPKTWEEFYALIPELQKNNMQIGYPATLTGLQIFLYQSGISLYADDLTKSNISNDGLMDKFTQLMDLYTVYTFPVAYDPANRFRTGEIPLLIADYTLYNQLSVFAPEIRGQWGFTCLPGTEKEDGSIDYASPITTVSTAPVSGAAISTASTGIMMLRDAKDREASWNFMKWWVSEETQTEFCREMETVLGPSGKHPTANYKALANLSWTAQEYKQLSEQFKYLVGTPEVPGGYYISRYFDFAFNETYNEGTPAYRAFIKYEKTINDEITRKRQEFGLAQ